MNILSRILHHKIIAIIRGADPGKMPEIAASLFEGGIRLIEVTLNSPNALELIAKLNLIADPALMIGAGTVLDEEDARRAIDAGAKFIISPVLDTDIIRLTRSHGIVSIPGAYTPTEILKAYSKGGDIIKVFPASAGVQYLKDIRGPLPQIPLMPTGGININNIREYFDAGAVAFGIGSSLFNAHTPINDAYLQELVQRARQFVTIVDDINKETNNGKPVDS